VSCSWGQLFLHPCFKTGNQRYEVFTITDMRMRRRT